jgi:glucan-binding YG repeat protein
MTLTYEKRNLDNIANLADNTKAAALKWHAFLVANNIDILIYETIRTEAQQRENVAKGASQTMNSYHLKGQALDFVLIKSGKEAWNGYNSPDVKKAVAEAKCLGFEWGGDWTGFVDQPHLQFNFKGYGTDTFGKLKDGWVKDNGKWYFYKNGKTQTSWIKDRDQYYFCDQNGVLIFGWLTWNGKRYYLTPEKESGRMVTGINEIGGRLYYFNKDGSLAQDTKVNVTLNVGPDGAITN